MVDKSHCRECGREVTAGLLADGLCQQCLPSTIPGVSPPTADTCTSSDLEIAAARDHPDHIGPYKILRILGQGGMGIVYLAEQEHPIRRTVALKVIKLGMDTKEVIARFESERQALALMNHPNVAKVLDAGATEHGTPYFVMEYVAGISIADYCDRHRLNTRERLELFMPVCQAIQHAHQKGIIHRDIKPSNVLVSLQDDKPVPKVIDFGVAKATNQRLTEKTLFTQRGFLIGTPQYMSPEQAEMTQLDVDTRTDIYSLGVTLYELLVGALPFDAGVLRRAGYDEIRRIIREEESPRPTTRLRSLGQTAIEVANRRRTDLESLQKQLRGDLDWITMKAIEKDRTRRYQSASELEADIRRHLNDEAVIASPPGAMYRIRKFARRHKTGVAAAGLVVLAIIIGIAGITIGLVRAIRAERAASKAEGVARQEAETAKQVSDFLVGLFAVSDPSEAKGNSITAREILDRGAEKIKRDLRDQPLVRARILDAIGRVYRSLGLYESAVPLLEESLEIRRQILGEENLDVSKSLGNVANVHLDRGDFTKAKPLFERAIAIGEKSLGPDHPDLAVRLNNLANLLLQTGDYEGGRQALERALAIREKSLGPVHPETAITLTSLGLLYYRTGEYAKARSVFERALSIREEALGPDHPSVADSLNNLAVMLQETGDYAGARPLLERTIKTLEKVLGPDHPRLAAPLHNLANLLRDKADYSAAKPLYQRAVGIHERSGGAKHPELARVLANLADLNRRIGDHREAKRLFERAVTTYEQAFGPEHADIGLTLFGLGRVFEDSGDYGGARSYYQRALAIQQKVLPSNHPDLAWSLNALAYSLAMTGRPDEARTLHERALAIFEKIHGPKHPDVAWVLRSLGDLLANQRHYAEARAFYERALAIQEEPATLWKLARLHFDQGRLSDADPLFKQALELREKALGPDNPDFIYDRACYAALVGNRGAALLFLRRAVDSGFSSDRLTRDADLSSLRGDPEFEAIVAEVKKRIRRK